MKGLSRKKRFQARFKINVAGGKLPLPDNWLDFARLCDIRTGGGVSKFDPYQYQLDLIENIEKHKSTVILKTRQLGITETVANWFLFNACTKPGYLCAVFSKGQSDTSEIAKRVRLQAESLSDYITLGTDSLVDISVIGGGRILFRNSTPNGARGLASVSHLFFDEADYVPDIVTIYGAAQPCTAMAGDNARVIVNCTPNNTAGWYWDRLIEGNGDRDILQICEDIRRESMSPATFFTAENGWCKAILHWYAHPIYSKRKDTYLSDIARDFGIPEDEVQREYNLSFNDSEVSVFNPLLVKSCAIGAYEDAQDAIYYQGIDTSLLGQDSTVSIVLKETMIEVEKEVTFSPSVIGLLAMADNPLFILPFLSKSEVKSYKEVLSVVKMYKERKKTHETNIYKISEIISKYKPVTVGIEINGSGAIYCENLIQANLGCEIKPIVTTNMSKHVMINKLLLTMERGELIYPDDKRIVEELLSFRKIGDKLEASSGKHDDIVMALAFAVAVANQ